MKNLKFGGKLVFIINSLVAFLLLVSYLLPFIPPKSFALLSVLSLSVPFLILMNALFFVYWLLRVKKQLLLSLIVLLLGWSHINSMYKFSGSKSVDDPKNITLMSYNVRLFNLFQWIPNRSVKEEIVDFISKESPDVFGLQEYRRGNPIRLEGYHNFNATYTKNTRGGLAIFSKFPIVNSGSLEFPNTDNNAIFADIKKGQDTIRIYNLHLQSARIHTSVDSLKKEKSSDLFKQVGKTFKAQQDQVELFLNHKAKSNYKTIILGDFNNTAFSYIYKKVKGDSFRDTFKEAGNGFGRTYNFKRFPLRIDFILTDTSFVVNGFKNYDIKLSDHYPIMATVKLND